MPATKGLMWFFAVFVSLLSLRYLAPSPRYLFHFQIVALVRHHLWFASHIACGALTLSLGLFQFSNKLRARRPALHRSMGYVYVAAVLIGGVAGLRLSPDTPSLLSEGLTEQARMDSVYGIRPGDLAIPPGSTYIATQFAPIAYSFAALALAWLFTTGVALRHALRRDFSRHRAWMLRSYSLTFAAVTVRLVVLPLGLVTGDPVLATNLALCSWILNLGVAEWLIRRAQARPLAATAHA